MQAGLYCDNKLIYSWEKLIDLEIISIRKKNNENCLYYVNFDEKEICELIIDNNIQVIEEDCFAYTTIKSIYINDNIKSINESSLDNSLIAEIKVSPKNKWFSSEDGVLYNKDKSVLIAYPSNKKDKEFNVPYNVQTIGNLAFASNLHLEKIILPKSLERIKEAAFINCKKLKEIILPNELKKIEKFAFLDCKKLEKIKIPDNINEIDVSVFSGCTKLKEVLLNNTKRIGVSAFKNCTSLEKIVIPNSVTEINGGAFYDCIDLEYIKLSNKLKDIGSFCLNNCKNIKTIDYPGDREEFEKIKGWENIFDGNKLTLDNIQFDKTLDDLINEGYNLIEANKIMKEQEERAI